MRSYLVGLLLLFMVAAGVGVWSGWVQARNDALSNADADALFAARRAAQQIGVSLTVVRGSVDTVASNPGVSQVFADPSSCRLAFSLGGVGDGHLDVLRTDGTVVCSSTPPTGAAQASAYVGASWLPDAVGAPRATAPEWDGRTGRTAAVITAPIVGLGVVAAFVDLVALGSAAGNLFGGPRQLEFVMTTADHATILTRWPDGIHWTGTQVRDSRFAVADAGGTGVDVTGVRRIYGQADVDVIGWQVSAGADRAAALTTADRLARNQALIAGLGLLAGLLATLLVQRRITRPIGRLRAAIRAAITSGNLDTAVTVAGPREVGELGEEFNTLLATVDRQLGQRRRAEEVAGQHERNYRQMFAASPYPIVLFDLDSMAVVAVNDAAVGYYGWARDELLTMAFTALCPPEDVAALAEAIATAAPVERERRQRHIKRDGTVSEVTVTSYVTSFAGRKVRCAVINDVTEREHLQRRLRRSERLESLGHLAAGIAHDFNNLLGVINGYAGMATADIEPIAARDPVWRAMHDDLVQIVAAGDRATALTRQLLAFASADPEPETQILDLNSVITDVAKLLRRALGEDITLIAELTAQPWQITADPGRLEQVLVNLAVNARDAMPGGGTLTISTEQVTVDEYYAAQHPGLRAGRYMQMRVSDTGAGMTKATLERAFEPFFTTKAKGHGTGLGLATIYGIITQAGGHAQIYSELGQGTTITALLPATEDAADPITAPSSTYRDGSGETILLVEDDDSLRALTERILHRDGYLVLSATTVADARHLAATHPDLDLLLTDVVMPEMHGPALADLLRTTHPNMRLIYMSGYSETILATRNIIRTGAPLLTKPVSAHRLLNAVARVLDSQAPDTSTTNHPERQMSTITAGSSMIIKDQEPTA
jgi:PAS domain S-box-containing protein